MNGMKPNFLRNSKDSDNKNIYYTDNLSVSSDFYYGDIDPYKVSPSCHINLLELSRYAQKLGKKLVELTQEEIKKFAI